MISPQSFIFIGRSGCGKGTQAKLLIEHLKQVDPDRNTLYVQSGAEFRDFIKGEGHTQELSKKIFDGGGLLPEFLAIYFWTNRIIQDFTSQEHLICDGMPRRYHEAGVLDSIFEFYSLKRPHVIYLNVSENWSRFRLTERHRVDDTRQEIDNRLSWFNRDVVPTLQFYKNNPLYTFHDIDGERPMNEVHADIRKLVPYQ